MAKIENIEGFISEKDSEKILEFLSALSKMDPVKIFGVARTMGIDVIVQGADTMEDVDDRLAQKKIEMRPSDEIIIEMVERFLSLNRRDRRLLMGLVRAAK